MYERLEYIPRYINWILIKRSAINTCGHIYIYEITNQIGTITIPINACLTSANTIINISFRRIFGTEGNIKLEM